MGQEVADLVSAIKSIVFGTRVTHLRVILPSDFFNSGFSLPEPSSTIFSRISMFLSSGKTSVISVSRWRSRLSTHWRAATVVMSFVHDAIQQTVSAVNF